MPLTGRVILFAARLLSCRGNRGAATAARGARQPSWSSIWRALASIRFLACGQAATGITSGQVARDLHNLDQHPGHGHAYGSGVQCPAAGCRYVVTESAM
jgi:hypothetical protein